MSLKSLSGLKIGNYTLPTSDGTNGQVLQTDGSGNVTFQSVSISDKFTSGLSFDTSTGVLTATVTNGSNVTEDLDGRYVLLGGDTMSGDLTITHAGSPSLHLIDTTNDVDFRLRAANSYVTFEADRDNDAGSSRMQFKIDGSLQYEILPSSTQTFADSTSFIRKDVTGSLYGGDRTRKDKLLKKQKKGKQRLKQFGKIDIPQSAFLEALKTGENKK